MAFEMIELSTKFKSGVVGDLVRAAKSIRKLKENEAKVYFPNLGEPQKWKMVIFTDAAHANLSDGVSSMGAHVVLLVGPEGDCCPLSWQAKKIKRVVRSTIAAETLSMLEGLEDGFCLRKLLEEVLNLPAKSIPLEAYNDNRSVVEAVYSTKLVDDKRLRLDIGAVREMLQSGEVNVIRWCPGSAQIANCMTKKGAPGNQLLNVLQSGKLAMD
jgi:hypothetical protein